MSLSYYTPRVLTGIINLRPVKHGLFTSFFTPKNPSAVDVFELQTSLRGASLMPSITNHAAGVMRKSDTLSVGWVKAPRFRPKRHFAAAELLKTQAGQSPYDLSVSPVEYAVAQDMDAHRDDIDFMLEVMCAQALVNGKIELYDVVEGTTVKTYTVDFNRPQHHTVTLTGDAAWTSAKADLIGTMDTYDLMIQEATSGYSATDLVLGKDAWTAFRKHPDVKDTLDNRNINIGTLAPTIGAKLKGEWNGLRIWTTSSTYQDVNGSQQYYLPPDSALLVAAEARSEIEYGRPVDIHCTGPCAIFAKQFTQEDPSGVFTIAESRPLPITRHCGCTVVIKVK